MAEAENSLTTNPQPQTSTQPKAKKKRTFLKSILWMLFFLIFFAVIAYAVYDYTKRGELKLPDSVDANTDEIIVRESPEFEAKEIEEKAVEEVAPATEAAVVADPVPDTLKQEMNGLNAQIATLTQQNKNILIYFLARDLKESINDKTTFSAELQAFSAAVGENQEIGGKIEILKQSVASDYETPEKLREDLKNLLVKVAAANRKGFGETVTSAFGELVKVSKISGEVKKGDYESIIKRAEITLSKEKLSAKELEQTIKEITTLGVPAQAWVQKANNLQRIVEVTDYLVEYSKTKVIGL